MSLYISDKQFPKMESAHQPDVPVLLEIPGLPLQHRVFPRDFGFSNLLLDSFELVNPEFAERAYPMLPYVGLRGIFLFESGGSNAVLCGPSTTLKRLSLPPRSMAYCVRFRPVITEWFTGVHANELTDRSAPLSQYKDLPQTFLNALRRGESFHERNILLTRQFYTSDAAHYTPTPLISRCVELILSAHGIIKVSAVAEAAGCSERYLNRVFQQRIGVSTKLFCELTQLQHSLNLIVSTKPRSLLNTALTCGYFDQTHMNRSYRKFLDCTASDMRYMDGTCVNLRRVASIL